ncbi:hypothetical protein DRQ17_05240 [bacterium]|nr:MAG: hypothetical protein DRQ17_05240 [bacterium]RKZ23076.1 MAG: hypothetical protein DRQ23_03795 [bacterium]
MKVKDVMLEEIPKLSRNDGLLKAVGLFSSFDLDIIPVVDEDNNYIGVVRKRDLIWPFLSFLEEDTERGISVVMDYPSIYLIDDVMEWDYPSVEGEKDIATAIGMMEAESLEAIPVVEEGRLIGILTNSIILNLFFPETPS